MTAEELAELKRANDLKERELASSSTVDPRIREPLVIKDEMPPSVSKDNGWD